MTGAPPDEAIPFRVAEAAADAMPDGLAELRAQLALAKRERDQAVAECRRRGDQLAQLLEHFRTLREDNDILRSKYAAAKVRRRPLPMRAIQSQARKSAAELSRGLEPALNVKACAP